MIEDKYDDFDSSITCPECEFSGDTDDFDNLGASGETNVFCTRCNCEFDPDTGVKHGSLF